METVLEYQAEWNHTVPLMKFVNIYEMFKNMEYLPADSVLIMPTYISCEHFFHQQDVKPFQLGYIYIGIFPCWREVEQQAYLKQN